MNPFYPNQSVWIRKIRFISDWSDSLKLNVRIHSNWFWMGLGLIRIEKFLRIRSEWNWLIRIQIWDFSEWISIRNFPNHSRIFIHTKQFRSDLIRSNFSNRINPRPIQKQSECIRSIRFNHNESDQTESIRMNPVNPINSNFQFEWILSIRINSYSDWKFGVVLINSDWTDSFGLILNRTRIDSDWKISSD